MSLTRKELDRVYDEVKGLYRRKERDKDIQLGIDIMYQSIMDYIEGKEIKRI